MKFLFATEQREVRLLLKRVGSRFENEHWVLNLVILSNHYFLDQEIFNYDALLL